MLDTVGSARPACFRMVALADGFDPFQSVAVPAPLVPMICPLMFTATRLVGTTCATGGDVGAGAAGTRTAMALRVRRLRARAGVDDRTNLEEVAVEGAFLAGVRRLLGGGGGERSRTG